MAGFAIISLQQFLNPTTFRPYSGAKAFFYEAGTFEPLDTYTAAGLGATHPNPVEADSTGRFPAIFLDEADSFYRVRVTQRNGSAIPLGNGPFDVDSIPIIGPSGEGGGSEVPVDPNALFTTGDTLWVPKSGTRTGWVRMNGRTIGSATSGAAERANADVEALFAFIWDNFADTICAVTGGRGANAAADFAANKPVAVLDMRGRGPFGVDDMGNSDAARLHSSIVTTGTTLTPGASGGTSRHTLTEAELPALTKTTTSNSHSHPIDAFANVGNSGAGNTIPALAGSTTMNTDETAHDHTVSFGSGTAHSNMSPFALGTWLWKI